MGGDAARGGGRARDVDAARVERAGRLGGDSSVPGARDGSSVGVWCAVAVTAARLPVVAGFRVLESSVTVELPVESCADETWVVEARVVGLPVVGLPVVGLPVVGLPV